MKQQPLTFAILFFAAIEFFLPLTIKAQGTVSDNQGFNITFSEISGSGTNQPSGGAVYYQTGWDYDTFSPATNLFVISINVGTTAATDGQILQMESDGSLSPVMELTNEFGGPVLTPGSPAGISSDNVGYFPGNNPPAGSYIYSQNWQLTNDQLQSLLAGDWYAEIDYGGNTYLGNLTPVPEPETLALLGLGIAAIYFRDRKARK